MKNNESVIKLEGYTDKRSIVTNPIFSNGYSVGWRFAVPEAFKAALDIKVTTRKEQGKSITLLTQGNDYSFSAHDTIYNTPKAYKIWKEALKELEYCVEIQDAIPAQTVIAKEYKIDQFVIYSEDKKPTNKQAKFEFIRTRTNSGYVKFKLLKPDQSQEKLELCGEYETDQEKFVYFLQTGRLITKNNEVIEV